MFKKFLFLLSLPIVGIVILYFLPLRINEDPTALISSKNIREDFMKSKNLDHRNQLSIILTDTRADIFNPYFLDNLRKLTDDIFYLPGVDRPHIASIFTNNVEYRDIIKDGFEGGPLVPKDFFYSQENYAQIKNNLMKSPYLGYLVSYDFKSALIKVPFLGAENGPSLSKKIEQLLPKNNRIHSTLLGYVPYTTKVQKALTYTTLCLLISWLLSIFLFYIFTRQFLVCIFLFLGPIATLVFECLILRSTNLTFHPFIFIILFFIFILSFLNIAAPTLTFDKHKVNISTWQPLLAVISLCLLGSPIGFQIAGAALVGVICLLTTRRLFLKFPHPSPKRLSTSVSLPQPTLSTGARTLFLFFLLIFGLTLSSELVVGNFGVGPQILRNTHGFVKEQQLATDQFAFSLDSILVASFTTKGCTDPATVSALEKFHWFLTGLPSVRSVWSLDDAVKKLNVFFHENNLKWNTVPAEKTSLVAATSMINPSSGLLDDEGLVLPVTIYLQNRAPETLAQIYKSIKKFPPAQNLFSLKIVGGTAGIDAICNDELSSSIKKILLIFLLILFLITLKNFPPRTTIKLCFLFLVILSLTLGLIARFKIGLSVDTLEALVLSSCLCIYFLWALESNPCCEKKLEFNLLMTCLIILGGLYSELNFVFHSAVTAQCMLLLTWVLGFKFSISKENS